MGTLHSSFLVFHTPRRISQLFRQGFGEVEHRNPVSSDYATKTSQHTGGWSFLQLLRSSLNLPTAMPDMQERFLSLFKPNFDVI